MDGYHDHPSEFEVAAETAPPADAAAAIGTDERRMHVRAYNYWVSLLDGRDFPSIEDLEPGNVEDFAANSVLLDFTCGRDNPATPYIGAAIRAECELDTGIASIEDVPSRSLLSRLTDHYMQIIANRAPVGFEAEFVNQRGAPICYRGILMPFSSDGDTIDFIYGVINWKESGPKAQMPLVPTVGESERLAEPLPEAVDPADRFAADDGIEPADVLAIELDRDAGLADRLAAARDSAEAVKAADGRTRAALYRALGQAYDFAVAALRNPADYAELLAESGMKAQARAPMTPVVKLVFGIDYDKTRLTEFAATLAHARRHGVSPGGLQAMIESRPGGLKAVVAAERRERRPKSSPDEKGEQARERLRSATRIALAELSTAEEFRLLVVRRSAAGGYEAVALVDDPALVERAVRSAA